MPDLDLRFGFGLFVVSLELAGNVDALRYPILPDDIHGPNHIDGYSYIPVEYRNHESQRLSVGGVDDSLNPLQFTFISTPIDAVVDGSSDSSVAVKRDAIMDLVLPKVADQWSNALYLAVPVFRFAIPAGYCDLDIPYTVVDDKDIAIIVNADNTFCSENTSTLAYAYICAMEPDTKRPLLGVVNFCLDTITVQPDGTMLQEELELMYTVLVHEVGHTLGLISQWLKYFRNSTTGEPLTPTSTRATWQKCVNGKEDQQIVLPNNNTLQYKEETVLIDGYTEIQRGYYEITLPTVRQVVRNQFACQSLTGARLENQPTNPMDCYGSHLDERFFLSDIMSAALNGKVYFSPLTLALLEDSGFYKANFDYARNSPFGLGAGCGFVEDKCIVDGKVSDSGKGFFCDTVFSSNFMCAPSLRNKARCDLFKGSQAVPVPYFYDTNLGPQLFTLADHCPLVLVNDVTCNDEDAIAQYSPEIFGSDSKCISFLDENGSNSGMCLKTICNETTGSYDFYVGDDMYSCTQDFQTIEVVLNTLQTYTFECPRLAAMCPDIVCPAMCSGKGICDWSLPKPACKCFDPDNLSSNCNTVAISERSSSAAPSINIHQPSQAPNHSNSPSTDPSLKPSTKPTTDPSLNPSTKPTTIPSYFPSDTPSVSEGPTTISSNLPSGTPSTSREPTTEPSDLPSEMPSTSPKPTLSLYPTSLPSIQPILIPTSIPSLEPTPVASAGRRIAYLYMTSHLLNIVLLLFMST